MMTWLILFVLTLLAVTALYTFLGAPFWAGLLRDVRGQMGNMANVVLADRGDGGVCNMERIQTGKYPFFSTTLFITLDGAGNGTVNFEAERDLLLWGMSTVVPDAAPHSSTISVTYCNTKYVVQQSTRVWARCCDRKPIFLVGITDNKKLEITVNGGTPAGTAEVTLYGLQGNGCCD